MGAATAIDKQITRYLMQLNDKQKKAVLTVVKTFAEEQEENGAWTDEAYTKEMNKRLAEYESGEQKGYTLEQTEARARQHYKNKRKK